jgi:hypothetical protein
MALGKTKALYVVNPPLKTHFKPNMNKNGFQLSIVYFKENFKLINLSKPLMIRGILVIEY